MKSAAFNLAFKVHRNELPFAEGLVKAVEAQAQEDFIHALNSLAGETKYDVEQLESLVDEALQGLNPDDSKPKVNIKSLKEEIGNLKKKRKDLEEGIETLEHQNAALVPSITPGINSFLLGLVGGVLFVILLILGVVIGALLTMVGTLGGAIFLLAIDMSNLNKQKVEINRKKARNKEEIKKIKSNLKEIEAKLEEKEKLLASAQQQTSAEEENTPASSNLTFSEKNSD